MPVSENVNAAKSGFMERIWKFFISLKLVIFLFLILSALSIVGTVIEQNKPLREYYRVFKPETVALFEKIGLLDMYHSWWFVTLLALLALNIFACTLDRYPAIMRGFRKKNLVLDDSLEKTINPVTKMKYDLPRETVETKMMELVGKKFSRKPVITVTEGGDRHYFFEKGRYSRLAFFFTHLSVLLIFFGSLLGSFFGYKGYVTIFEGESVSQVGTRKGDFRNLDFTVKCNSFTADFYPSGMPKDYLSDLSVVKDGKEILRKTIRVNDPLTFGGISFFQSSYGALPKEALIEVHNQDGSVRSIVKAPFGQRVVLPDLAAQIEVADYQEHLHLPDGSEGGRAVGVNIYPEQGIPSGAWLLMDHPDYDKMRGGPYYLQVKDLQLRQYTGLQVNKDPGEWVVWTGSLLLIGGIMIAFFVSHKRLWICLKKDKKGRTELTIGGTANKNRSVFSGELEGITGSLKENLS